MELLGQNIHFGTAGAIGVAVGGLAQIVGEAGQICTVGRNGADCGHGAALAGIAYSHSTTASLATKALHGNGAVRLNAHIHAPTLGVGAGRWQEGLHDA